MSRPETTNDVTDRFVRVAMFETEQIMTNAILLEHYTALLYAITKMGGHADKSYSSIDLNIPKDEKQLEAQLRNDQYRWDEMQKLYNVALKGDTVTDPVPEWRRNGIKEWAKEEGLPDPFDVFAANNEDIQKLRDELGFDA